LFNQWVDNNLCTPNPIVNRKVEDQKSLWIVVGCRMRSTAIFRGWAVVAERVRRGTVGSVPRYTPKSDHEPESPLRRRPLSVRIGVWVLLVGVVALVFADVVAALL
jgi:hypothetical protein